MNLIRNAFFDTIVSLFIGYNQFIITDDDGETTFNIKSFIDSKSEASKDFYDRFFPSKSIVENQMFMNFLNLQHLGEVDEEQQLRKQHFDIRAKDILSSTSNVPLTQQAILKKLSSELGQVSKIKRKETASNRQIPDILTYAQDQLSFNDIRRQYLQPSNGSEAAAFLYPLIDTKDVRQSQKSDTERVSLGHEKPPILQYRIFPKFRMDLFERCE